MQPITVSSAEFQRHFGLYQDAVLNAPVVVTRNGRERIVVLSAEEYHRLKRRDRQVLSVDDFTPSDLEDIRSATPPVAAANFDLEWKG